MLIEKIETSLLTEEMIRECDDFFQYIVIKRLNRGLRNQMMFYLTNQEVPFPDYKEFLEDLRYLFDFLDTNFFTVNMFKAFEFYTCQWFQKSNDVEY